MIDLRSDTIAKPTPEMRAAMAAAEVDFVPSVLAPKHGHREPYDLKWIRVDLYCYWPAGRVWVKDVTLKLVESPGRDGSVLDPMAPTPAGRKE